MTSKLEQVVTGAKPERFRYFFYGEKGIGKSSISKFAPNSIFFDLEGGLRFIDCVRYPLPEGDLTLESVQAAIADLTSNPHEYQHLWLDGLEVLEALVHRVVVPAAARRDGKVYRAISDIGGGFAKGEKMALIDWRDLISSLERLQLATGMAVGFLGHSRLGKRKAVGEIDWDCFEPQIDSRAWNVLADWVDVFAYLAFEEGAKRKDDKNPRSRGLGFQTGKRFIHTARSATHYAGRRFPMPDRIEMVHPDTGDPWAPFAQAIDSLTMSENELLLAITQELDALEDQGVAKATDEWLGASKRTKDQLTRLLRKLRSH